MTRPLRLRPALLLGLAAAPFAATAEPRPAPRADAPAVIVVGAGLAGLAAAWEAAQQGAQVTVVEMSSVFGGHAVMAMGVVSIVDTPDQRARGIKDSPELAAADILRWAPGADEEWVRFYARESRTLIHDWLVGLGVRFSNVVPGGGGQNRVPRVHHTSGRGIGLVVPVLLACLEQPGISFRWNSRVTGLSRTGGRIDGVTVEAIRGGAREELRGHAVVIATGGFQNNLELVRRHWPGGEVPPVLLAGSGVHSIGLGHEMARAAGAGWAAMDRQMHLARGLPDPRFPGANRGLHARIDAAIWVNARGERFTAEFTRPDRELEVLLGQEGATSWSIFDADGAASFHVSGSDWGAFAQIESRLLRNPAITRTAPTLAALATAAGLPPAALAATVARYNDHVRAGRDADFGRFPAPPPRGGQIRTIEKPPFHAVQFFPLTRKSMGGVAIDGRTRVRDARGDPIPGLYAAGEVTGSALINGTNGMSGMFLGPCIVTGRVAGRQAVAEAAAGVFPTAAVADAPASWARRAGARSCTDCHAVAAPPAGPDAAGWLHFTQVHRVVQARQLDCRACHADMGLAEPGDPHRRNLRVLAASCVQCHLADEG